MLFVYTVKPLSGRVLDSRPKGRGFESHRRHCVVSLIKNTNPSLVLVQPRKTRPFITERLLMGRKESNQTQNYRKLVFKTNYHLMQVKGTAECSKGSILLWSILQYFRPSLNYRCHKDLYFVYFWAAVLHRFYCRGYSNVLVNMSLILQVN